MIGTRKADTAGASVHFPVHPRPSREGRPTPVVTEVLSWTERAGHRDSFRPLLQNNTRSSAGVCRNSVLLPGSASQHTSTALPSCCQIPAEKDEAQQRGSSCLALPCQARHWPERMYIQDTPPGGTRTRRTCCHLQSAGQAPSHPRSTVPYPRGTATAGCTPDGQGVSPAERGYSPQYSSTLPKRT